MPVDNDKVLAIFNEAKQLSIESQKTFLSEACGGDEELRNEVDTLLKFHSDSSQTILDVDSAIDYSTGDMIGPFKVYANLVRVVSELSTLQNNRHLLNVALH